MIVIELIITRACIKLRLRIPKREISASPVRESATGRICCSLRAMLRQLAGIPDHRIGQELANAVPRRRRRATSVAQGSPRIFAGAIGKLGAGR